MKNKRQEKTSRGKNPKKKHGVHRLRSREIGRTVFSVGFTSEHREGKDSVQPRGPPTGIHQ